MVAGHVKVISFVVSSRQVERLKKLINREQPMEPHFGFCVHGGAF